jgi:nickel-dependent lactate racemase
MNKADVHEANQITTRKFIRNYLPNEDERNTWTVEGACITARRFARSGIPADATCWRYLIEHTDGGWSYSFRAVWRDGSFMQPNATHAVIENYYVDDESLVADKDTVILTVNEWLHTVPL